MKQEDLKILLYFAEERGDDSCGVATPDTILKKAESPMDFILKDLPVGKNVLGHTRAKTTGLVIDKNAHPFTCGEYVGIHNGSVFNFNELQDKEETNFDVDSEIIWYLFNKYGVKKGMSMLKGWFALAWLDAENKLNLFRHSFGDLVIGERDGNLYFGSEKHYLESIDCENIREIPKWKWYVIDNGEIEEKIDMKDNHPQIVYKSDVRKRDGGQNTQSSNKKPDEKSKSVPSTADYIAGTDPEGVGYWYWNGINDTSVLFVQPTCEQMDFEPALEKFQLTNALEVKKLVDNYYDVYKEVEKRIPETAK